MKKAEDEKDKKSQGNDRQGNNPGKSSSHSLDYHSPDCGSALNASLGKKKSL